MNHPFLRARQVEGQGFIQRMKTTANQRESITRILLPTFHHTQDLQLDVEQLFELESRPCVLHGEGVFREMDVDECVREAHQPIAL